MIGRIQAILKEPKAEFQRIDAEPATVGGIMTGWVVPLAAIGPLAMLIGSLAFGFSMLGITYRPSVTSALTTAVTSYVLALIGAYVCSLVVSALAPSFGGQKDPVQALKAVAYASTAAYLAGIFQIVPMLGILGLVGLYSLYLYYVGLPILMKVPQDKAVVYLIVVIVVVIVVMLVIGAVSAAITNAFVPRVPIGSLTYG